MPALGRSHEGLTHLDNARRELGTWSAGAPAWLRDWLDLAEVETCRAGGDLERAEALLERVEGVSSGPAPTAVSKSVAEARLQLATGDAAGAARTLSPCLTVPEPVGSPRPLIEACIVDAVAALELGQGDRSFESLERALALAEREGFRRVFVEAGPEVRAMLVRHLGSATQHRPFLGALLDVPVPTDAWPPGTFEALSERERTVLRYLPSRLSAAEIAAELNLSVHTVKSHLRHVYRKLGVGSRREAVDRARRLKLL